MIDGNDIWEALFSIMKGDVPEAMTEAVCQALADTVNRCALEEKIAAAQKFAATSTRTAPEEGK